MACILTPCIKILLVYIVYPDMLVRVNAKNADVSSDCYGSLQMQRT
jgi:hypothetical protein